MIRPLSASRKPHIYLLDPYDPKKRPLLMVHGLQSTPVGFAALVNALRNDPEVRAKYQIWQFYYASGTPVLLNALELRDSLNETLHAVDPKDHDAATKRIVVLRTLSPRSPALFAVSKLSIEVPYHSVIGQHYAGPKERGSDGVVPYWSSHLDGAESELIVGSGHGVFNNRDAVRETIRILHLEESASKHTGSRRSASHGSIASPGVSKKGQSAGMGSACAIRSACVKEAAG
jgi:hypothetical protein